MNPWNLVVWAGYWLGSFLVLEGLATFKTYTLRWFGFAVPWDTFSRFVWDAQTWRYVGTAVTLLVLFVLSTLIGHLVRFRNITEADRILERHDKRLQKQQDKVVHQRQRLAVRRRELRASG